MHANEETKEGTDTSNSGTDGDGRWLFAGESRTVSINKDILRSYCVWLFTGTPEEVLKHTRVAFNCPARTRALFFLGQEGIESPLPAGSSVSEINDCCSHW
jgi:hypothetical protein